MDNRERKKIKFFVKLFTIIKFFFSLNTRIAINEPEINSQALVGNI